MARRVLMEEVSVGRVLGRPRFDWMDGVTGGLRQQRNDGGSCAKNRKEWRDLVHS